MYSQNNEDKILLEYYKDKTDGVLIEIGAFESKKFSNSRALIEKGWTAYLIDASPFCISKLFEEYKENSKIHIIQSIVTKTKESGLISFWDSPFSAFSSTNKDNLKRCHKSAEEFDKKTREIFLSSISINEILEFVKKREGTVDFLSIDVEGFSAELSLEVDLNIVKPSCMCIEHDKSYEKIIRKFWNDYEKKLINLENLIIVKK
jgi:FkbM family methyltransferase